MNRVQQKKWISVLGMGVFILTMLSICILNSDGDKRNVSKNAVATHKMQQNTDNDLPVDFPKDLFFNSGAGGWRTYLRLNRDVDWEWIQIFKRRWTIWFGKRWKIYFIYAGNANRAVVGRISDMAAFEPYISK